MTTDPKSATPRTDKLVEHGSRNASLLNHMISHARTLERELADCKAELERQQLDRNLQWSRAEKAESRLTAHVEREGAEVENRQSVLRKLAGLTDPAPSAASGLADELKDYPNLQMMMAGCVSGQYTEWPMMRAELKRLVADATLTKKKYLSLLRSHQAPVGEDK